MAYNQLLSINESQYSNEGICICDEYYSGFKCQTKLTNDKPNLCHIKSLKQSCNYGICVPSDFKLNINYKSYYCQCNDSLNCKYKTDTKELQYLVFDQSNNTNKLDLLKPQILTGIESFIKNEAFNSLITNDYAKIPKGPFALFMQPINSAFDSIKIQFNSFIYNNYSQQINNQLNQLIQNRIKILVKDTLNSVDIDYIITKLQIFNGKNYTDIQSQQLASDIDSLQLLEENIKRLDPNILSIQANSGYYFNYTNVTFNIIRLDILLGVYIDSKNQLTLRPTPGLFLISKSNDLFFLPGLFTPNNSTGLSSIFTPGIMTLPIDDFNLDNLFDESTKYLNKFTPVNLPFNINGILAPFKSFEALNNSNQLPASKLLLTPIDFDSNFDFIIRDSNLMSKIFSSEQFEQIIQNEKLDGINLLSTQILSPNKRFYNRKRALEDSTIKGVQFYDLIKPNSNITIVPFVAYDNGLNPIQTTVIQKAIELFCSTYQNEINEFHSRICNAQTRTILLLNELNANCLTQNCSLLDFITEYYKPPSSLIIRQRSNDSTYIAILALAAVLSKQVYQFNYFSKINFL